MAQKAKAKVERSLSPADYMKKPYSRVLVPEEDGSFRAEIQEFPGCIALADTASGAYAKLEDTAESWIESALANGQDIPDPMESIGYSGKLVLRLPKSLHKKAARAAERDGASLNQFIVTCLAEYVGAKSAPATRIPSARIWLMHEVAANPSGVMSITSQSAFNMNTQHQVPSGDYGLITSTAGRINA